MPKMGVMEYARHRGVSHPAVVRAVKEHRIKKDRNGKIDSETADLSWALKTDPVLSIKRAPRQFDRAPSPPLAQAPTQDGSGTEHLGFGEKLSLRIAMQRLRKETAQADTAEIERDKLRGSVLPTPDVNEHIASLCQMFRDFIMAQADRLAAPLAAVDDLKAAHRILKIDGEGILRKLSKQVAGGGLS